MIALNIEKKLKAAQGDMNLEINLEIPQGHLVTLYGESGAGKTSTLRMIAGLLKPDSGSITVNGQTWFDPHQKINLPPQKRAIGYVFQDYALFPNMTVRENLEFALPKNGAKKIISELIEMVELDQLQHRKPASLSGGQKQRVALARSLVQTPRLLLLDEPLAALDTHIRGKLQDYLLEVHQRYGLTTLLVSHDIGEIIKLSDWVYHLKNGKVIRTGNPADLFSQSRDEVRGCQMNGEIVKIEKVGSTRKATVLIQTQIIQIPLPEKGLENLSAGEKVVIGTETGVPEIKKSDKG